MITKLAVRWLTWRLRKDKGFWMSYQANIAMIIYDNIERYFPLKTAEGLYKEIEIENEELIGE